VEVIVSFICFGGKAAKTNERNVSFAPAAGGEGKRLPEARL
jgi:hypothetical protein